VIGVAILFLLQQLPFPLKKSFNNFPKTEPPSAILLDVCEGGWLGVGGGLGGEFGGGGVEVGLFRCRGSFRRACVFLGRATQGVGVFLGGLLRGVVGFVWGGREGLSVWSGSQWSVLDKRRGWYCRLYYSRNMGRCLGAPLVSSFSPLRRGPFGCGLMRAQPPLRVHRGRLCLPRLWVLLNGEGLFPFGPCGGLVGACCRWGAVVWPKSSCGPVLGY